MIPHTSDIHDYAEILRPACIRCDTCAQAITSADDGWLEWLVDIDGNAYGLRIVHRASIQRGCHLYSHRPNQCGLPLNFFTDANGVAYWLNRIEQGYVRDRAAARRVLFRICGISVQRGQKIIPFS